MMEEVEGIPKGAGHWSDDTKTEEGQGKERSNNNNNVGNQHDGSLHLKLQEAKDFIEEQQIEILVVLEAIDPLMSGSFQALQSYCLEDLEFGKKHAECVGVSGARGGGVFVDMRRFHDIA